MVKIKKQLKSHRRELFGLLVVTLLIVAIGAYLYAQRKSSTPMPPVNSPKPTGTVNLEPATEQDKQAADNNKEDLINRNDRPPGQERGDNRNVVKPIITYAGQYGPQIEVGGYVPGVFEEGGTCTAKFTNGSNSFSKSIKAIRSANSTDCPAMVASAEEFSPKGSWSVVILYDSTTSAGISDSRTIEVR